MEEGSVPGGGVALVNVGRAIAEKYITGEQTARDIAARVFEMTLPAPYDNIMENAGMDVGEKDPDGSKGWDVKSRTYVDMYDAGIIDPTKVTICALRNAMSVATTILSTNAIITNQKK